MRKLLHVVGSRPNFMKSAPLMAALAREPEHFTQVLVHTGQHYDAKMSDVFFDELGLPPPDDLLNVGSGTHAEQTARVMLAFEPVVLRHKPDAVIVVGDVNSTVAAALVCAKLGLPVAHVEAGLRSGDRTMPEELNRLVTDQLSDLLFTPSPDGDRNLLREGIAPHKIFLVGNIMIDTLVRLLPHAAARHPLAALGLPADNYLLVTLHRPGNVDHPETLREILAALATLADEHAVIFPVHPRTRKMIAHHNLTVASRIHLIEPAGYLDFLALQQRAALVLTDSGGVQEETTYLGVPCVTVRPNTERPITIEVGTNRLAPATHAELVASAHAALATPRGTRGVPTLWDGHTAERIVAVLRDKL